MKICYCTTLETMLPSSAGKVFCQVAKRVTVAGSDFLLKQQLDKSRMFGKDTGSIQSNQSA